MNQPWPVHHWQKGRWSNNVFSGMSSYSIDLGSSMGSWQFLCRAQCHFYYFFRHATNLDQGGHFREKKNYVARHNKLSVENQCSLWFCFQPALCICIADSLHFCWANCVTSILISNDFHQKLFSSFPPAASISTLYQSKIPTSTKRRCPAIPASSSEALLQAKKGKLLIGSA